MGKTNTWKTVGMGDGYGRASVGHAGPDVTLNLGEGESRMSPAQARQLARLLNELANKAEGNA